MHTFSKDIFHDPTGKWMGHTEYMCAINPFLYKKPNVVSKMLF